MFFLKNFILSVSHHSASLDDPRILLFRGAEGGKFSTQFFSIMNSFMHLYNVSFLTHFFLKLKSPRYNKVSSQGNCSSTHIIWVLFFRTFPGFPVSKRKQCRCSKHNLGFCFISVHLRNKINSLDGESF